jgi:hypothetical protein
VVYRDKTMTEREIDTTADLVLAPYEQIELARVRLAKGEHTRYDGGRIIGRREKDLKLRFRGHEVWVNGVHEWELVEYRPVIHDAEKKVIEREWSA